jgi:hypothetical protein
MNQAKRTLVDLAKRVGVLLLLAGVAVTLFTIVLGLSIVHTVMHGDEETRQKTASEALRCSAVVLDGDLAKGCDRACLLRTYGSSATWWSSYTCEPLDGGP